MPAKRVREPRFRTFGKHLERWRGDRDVEAVARLVRTMGVPMDAGTLRGWEYGWTGRPDPLSLLALARVYGVELEIVLAALATSRSQPGRPIRIPGLGQDAQATAGITDRSAGLSDDAVALARTFDDLSKSHQVVVLATISAMERTENVSRSRKQSARTRSTKNR